MGLEERIKEEMYVDTESLLEDEFERAQTLFELYEDNTVSIDSEISAAGPKPRILVHLIAQQYIAEAEEGEEPVLSYDYFYERIEKENSTIRNYFSDLTDEGLIVQADKQGEYELVIERLDSAISRIKTEAGDTDS